ncbi:hypothetical protein GCM10009541_53700 [Micromonospora gifhornensis]|uniref:Uncharacterized protein n=1 Tax=Micromonospora gifhornensis TaxID=84594 RepID=A0ABQ4IKI4_9ACTN|nr:hypothetical protein [Micromonospora gifhornensis]GIJ18421.1 hypothetical protein Vgi01_51050 [Micromonospora gifhornensis]
MTASHHACFRLAPLPPLTDQPIRVGDLRCGVRRVAVWADRPARGLTRVMLVDSAGGACGDAVARGDTLTVSLPGEWTAGDRHAVTCLIAALVHQGSPDVGVDDARGIEFVADAGAD